MLLLIKLLKNAYPSEQVMKLLIKDVKRARGIRGEVLPHSVLCVIICCRECEFNVRGGIAAAIRLEGPNHNPLEVHSQKSH